MEYSKTQLEALAVRIRRAILESTTAAGSGHPTSSLSAVELMVGLMFGGSFLYRPYDPDYINNDRLIFSKGHAAPLLYALWEAAGRLSREELMGLRTFESVLEGHPTRRFEYTEVATGSLGQGLSVGVGMALAARADELSYRTYVLLGDSELAEGQNWEAMQIGSYYKLNSLVAVVDMNRLGQRGETMLGWDYKTLSARAEAFGWNAIVLEDGHDLPSVVKAYEIAATAKQKPTMIIARTIKGKGVSFLENKDGWHGKALSGDELAAALTELPAVEMVSGELPEPELVVPKSREGASVHEIDTAVDYEQPLAPRKAYGHALVEAAEAYPELVVLDAEVSNSTYASMFKDRYPGRFYEMFVAEQNMVSVGVGMARRGKIPFVSTFASFFTRAVDQIRVAQYSGVNLNLVGSHVGVSIGEDGFTQMGLEDIALFRAILDSVVVAPADHVATEKLVLAMIQQPGICYMRTTRMDVEPLYSAEETFEIGGSKTLRESSEDVVTLVGSGVTLYECLKAHESLQRSGIQSRVIDLYSIKPVDVETLVKACKETRALVVVEDHYAQGGMVEAVRSALVYETTPIHSLAVRKMPRSGKPEELMRYEGIDAEAIRQTVMGLLG